MRAVIINECGGPEVTKVVTDFPIPTRGPKQVTSASPMPAAMEQWGPGGGRAGGWAGGRRHVRCALG